METIMTDKTVKPSDIHPIGGSDLVLTKWKCIKVDDDLYLYYDTFEKTEKKAKKVRNGFNFYCINANMWDSKGKIIGCECLFNGTAYFDGIRHLYFGDKQTDNYGYLYYADLDYLIKALKKLEELEETYSRPDE